MRIDRMFAVGNLGRWLSAAAILWIVAGCGGGVPKNPLPQTYPVKGTVLNTQGKPLTGGAVQFRSEKEPLATTTGAIQSDGTFSLTTTRDGQRSPGAIAGPNRVTVIPPSPKGFNVPSVTPTVFPTPYIVEARENEFTLQVP